MLQHSAVNAEKSPPQPESIARTRINLHTLRFQRNFVGFVTFMLAFVTARYAYKISNSINSVVSHRRLSF